MTQSSSKVHLGSVGVGLGLLLLPLSALAQDTAAAGALFDQGIAEMESHHFDVACAALDESQRLEPRAGTLFASAECHAQWGKVASAVARYQDYVGLVSRLTPDQQVRHRERAATASAQIETLKPTVPSLTVTLASSAPAGTVVRRNGVELKGASLGLALPLDPGEHLLTVQAPGFAERQVTVTLALNEHQRIELEPPAAPERTEPAKPKPVKSVAIDSERLAANSSARTWGYVAGGLGLAGVAVGATTGLLAFSKKSTIKDHCDGSACHDQDGLDAADSGQTLATVSTVGFAVGAVGLVTGAVLLLTAPESTERVSRRDGITPLLAPLSGGAWAGVARHF